MIVLGFDASLSTCGVAVWRDGQVLARESMAMDRGQAERLMPMITEAMSAAGIEFATLDRIGVGCGPGSFTGVRVGLAAARGLALVTGCPVVGISTTEALAAAVHVTEAARADGIIAAVDSKRGDLFVQKFTPHGDRLSDIVALAPENVRAWSGQVRVLAVGDGVSMLRASWPDVIASAAGDSCDPSVIARLAAGRAPQEGGPAPIYIRPPDVTMVAGRGASVF